MRATLVLLFVVCGAVPLSAQQAPAARPFEILDNSFLVEEAFNQEAGIFQNIFGAYLVNGSDWQTTFTQEWPVVSQKHQFSYTLPFVSTIDPGPAGTQRGVGDLLLNYRYQALMEGPGRPAFSPRVSLVLPTGADDRGLGSGTVGLDANMPFSKQRGEIYWHWNAGVTLLPGAYVGENNRTGERVEQTLFSPFVAASAIARVRPMLNLMLESVVRWDHAPDPASTDTSRSAVAVLSPGLRGGWDIGDHQLIVGVAFPVTITEADDRVGVFGYFSYELPFMKPRPTTSSKSAGSSIINSSPRSIARRRSS